MQSATNNPYKGRAVDTKNMKQIKITQSFNIKDGYSDFKREPLVIENKKGAYSTLNAFTDIIRSEACALGVMATSKGLTDIELIVSVDKEYAFSLGGRNKIALPDKEGYLKYIGLKALTIKDLQVDYTAYNIMFDAIMAMFTYHIAAFLTEEERVDIYTKIGKEVFDNPNISHRGDLQAISQQTQAVAEKTILETALLFESAKKDNTTPRMDILREGARRSFELHNQQKSEQRKLAAAERKLLTSSK